MANPPKGKAKAKPAAAKKPASRSGKATASRAKAKPVDAGQKYVVSGTVTYADGSPAEGLTVIAYDKDVSGKDNLGQPVVTKESGTFAIPYSDADFRRTKEERGGADVIVCVYNAEKELLFTSKKQNNAPANYELNIKLPAQLFVVRGTVRFADGTPLAGALVRAFDRDLRKEQQLGKDETTDDRGQYIIRYGAEEFATGDVSSAIAPKLIVRAFAGDQQIDKDVVRPNPARDEVVDFTVSAPALSEWEKVSAGVIPLLKGQGEGDQTLPPWEINDSDLNFIAEETGLDREQIRLWALAFVVGWDALEMQPAGPIRSSGPMTHLPVTGTAGDLSTFAIFYGWFRLGLPSEPVALWATPSETLLSTLKTAITQGIVPANLGAELVDVSARVEQIKLDHILKAPALGTAASLGDLLATLPVPLNLNQQRVLAGAMNDLRPDDPELADSIAKISGFDGDAAGVARTLRLGDLTGGHIPLAQILQRQPQLLEDEKGTLRPLAALRPDEWIDLAYTHGTPSGLGISPVAYADALAESIELQHPTAALAAHVAKGRRLSNQPLLADVGTFLRDNPSFDIETANLNALAKETKLGGVAETKHPQLVTGLRAIQRMRLLTASLDETATLFENDLYSPHQLLAAGPGQLTAMLNGQLSSERATALYQQAEELHSTAFATITAALSPLSGPQILPELYGAAPVVREINPDDLGGGVVPTIPPQPFPDDDGTGNSPALKTLEEVLASRGGGFDPKKALTLREPPLKDLNRPGGPQLNLGGVIDRQPTLRALFGDQDACACGHCNSVLSPAAYFVDVLQFIKDAQILERLLKRRPDLEDIELSCNNTNTVVPAIDLALEALENAVALPLKVELLPGTNVEAELSGQAVGAEVRKALKRTVRNLADDLSATPAGSSQAGTADWTIVDGHRRWTLASQSGGLLAESPGRGPRLVDTTGLDLKEVIAALKLGKVSNGAEVGFARLFAPNDREPPDLTNYKKTITPLSGGNAWRVRYQAVAQLLIDPSALLLTLQTPTGFVWWPEHEYDQRTITWMLDEELPNGVVPELVQRLLASRFSKSFAFEVTPAGTDTWAIASAPRELTLRVAPAQLTIKSLAYQSGDPDADALAWPENHNPEAYARLKAAKFPWSLPVDLPLEEVRLFLDRARISRLRLIELMLPVDRQSQADAPVNTVPSAQTTREDTALVFSKANKNRIAIAGFNGTVTCTLSVTHGTLTVKANSDPDVNIKGNGSKVVTVNGMAAAVNRALDGMVFNPTADYNGPATLTITTTDAARIHVDGMKLTITPVADIAGDTAATEEDHAVTIPVLANDSFENLGRRITAINGLAITAGGSAVSVTHGAVKLDAFNQLIFTPTKDYNGQALFTYNVTSGEVTETATVYVTVNSANASSFALEVLGLSKAEATLIGAKKAAAEVYDYWGVSPKQEIILDAASGGFLKGASPLDLLMNVSILLQQSRLGFEELLALLATRFISGETPPLRIEPQNTCKPSEMTLPGLTTAHLDHLHRFARLWRKLGWTMRELDLAIEAFGGQLTPDTLLSLARVRQLQQQLDLPVASLIAGLHQLETQPWIDPLTEGAPVQSSLYASIFLREDMSSLSDFADFALQGDGKELAKANPNLFISTHANYIGACLGIKSSVVTGWVSVTDGLGIEDKLNLANLSRLTAAVSLCRALRITPEQLTHHLKLYGTPASPFRPAMSTLQRTEAVLEFVERFRCVEASGVDVETLRYLLQHYQARSSSITLDANQLKQFAGAARDAVRSIPAATEKSPPLTPAEEEVAAKEAVKVAQAIQFAREDAAIASLATSLGMNLDLIDELLRIRLRHPSNTTTDNAAIAAFLNVSFVTSAVSHSPTAAVPPSTAAVDPVVKAAVDAADKAVDDILVRLHKTLLICDALKLNLAQLRLLRASATDKNGFTALDFNTLPVTGLDSAASLDGFNRLLALAQLRGLAPGAGDLLHQYAAINFADGGVDAARTLLATGLDIEKAEVTAAANQLRIADVNQYSDPLALTRLIELLVALKQLGATVEQATGLTAPSPHDAAAVGARELLRSKYGASQWHDLIKPIADRLRERQRNALVDYLIARDQLPRAGDGTQFYNGPRLRHADDLYERYLIDVQTGSCLKTTRLLQATAAVQLFVQRVLLNLERGASLTDDKRKQWDWMRSYRVWEANRKVFLFPENWLLPELRDDKTAIFRQMESALTEQEPSPEITRAALLGYLEELGDLAQISVIAMYEDVRKADDNKVERTLYVVGRTPNTPYRYFWRSCAEFGDSKKMSWSGWEALDLDNANDFIMPFVMEGDLHVAWPIFRKTKEEKKEEQDSANLLWEVQLAWTRRTNKGWVKRKIGKAQLVELTRLPNKDEAASFAFRFNKKPNPIPGSGSVAGEPVKREKITFDCYAADELDQTPSLTPDPSLLLHVNPVPTNPSTVQGKNKRWNVSCEVQGIVYKFFKRPPAEGGPFYIGCEGATVSILDAKRRNNSETLVAIIVPIDVPVLTTGLDGAFKFSFPASQETSTNGGEGLLNEESLKLRIEIPGWPTFDKTVKLVKQGPPEEYAFKWIWTINHGVEDKALDKKLFPSDRKVKLEKVGAFFLETGKDLSSIKVTTKDPYVDDMAGFIADNNQLPVQDRRGALFPVVRATQSLGRVVPDIWSIKESDDSFCYLQLGGSKWRRWPDRHPFASIYRLDAASSSNTLFRLENQKRLHLDPVANNFDRQTAYANYNWELFLHAPLAIADYLVTQQRFEDARRWLHAVFDPTTNAKIGTSQVPQFWCFLEFQKYSQPDSIAQMLTWLADPKTSDPKVADFEKQFAAQIEEWKKNPFMPHVIARLRPSAYQWHTFFAYLDLLIGWGDQLFRRDTRESVNEATLLYVLAAKLLGPRPRVIRAATPPHALTYRLLQANKNPLDGLSNAWVEYADLPGVKQLVSAKTGRSRSSQSFALRRLGGVPVVGEPVGEVPARELSGTAGLTSLSSLAFCVPQNEKVTEFYDRVENRLFNVRNCRNIEGVFRDLPLYEPPIDPLLLIRARAAGLDITTALGDLYAPLPNYRFSFTLQKALELCGELKSLGGALLSALEKKDAEQLTLLRSSHEITMLTLVRETRQQQITEAEANIVALQQSEATILERFGQYQKLLGKTSVTKGQDGLPVVEQSSSLSVSTDPVGGVSGLGLSGLEVGQLISTGVAHVHTQAANAGHIIAGVLSLLPNIFAGTPFAGQTFGGAQLGGSATAIAKSIEMVAAEANYIASLMGTFAGYERRQDEWVHQSKLALAEVKQIQKQILAAEIRKSIAEHELSNHETQIENAQQVDEFMRGKFTSQQLYRWMSSQIAQVYFRTYQLALDQARRAERAYQHELGLDNKTTPFVKAGNWDSLKRGLLAGEKLSHDLKRLEVAYLDQNKREYEITKHISLLSLAPIALIKLRETGQCEIAIPEAMFDLDYPGHYLRRIKSVSLTIPCVTGPYTGVNCTLTLLKSSVRRRIGVSGGYARDDTSGSDSRFGDNFGAIQTVATSTGQNDSGLFETNLHDERYLPFEGTGVISGWRLEMPNVFRAFDYETITDVVLHMRYTARDGGGALRQQATMELSVAVNAIVQAAGEQGLARVFSLRHEFPTEWAQLTGASTGARSAKFSISKNRFPFFVQQKTLTVNQVDLFGVPLKDSSPPPTTLPTLKRLNLPVSTEAGAPFGSLLHQTARNLQVTIQTENNTNSEWELTTTNIADIGKLKDIIVVFGYTASGVS